jgi:hypothetical protein
MKDRSHRLGRLTRTVRCTERASSPPRRAAAFVGQKSGDRPIRPVAAMFVVPIAAAALSDRFAPTYGFEIDEVSGHDDVLDRIDETVQPGVTIDVVDTMWEAGTRALDVSLRRR